MSAKQRIGVWWCFLDSSVDRLLAESALPGVHQVSYGPISLNAIAQPL
jgi:hypothetical protein